MRRMMVLAASVAIVLVGASAATSVRTTQAATPWRWVIRDLGILGSASDINNRGQIVGWSGPDAERRGEHAFLWHNGKMRDLGTLGGPRSWAGDINERGQIVGTAYTSATGKDGDWIWRAFLWEKGKMRGLGTLAGTRSDASAINDRGQIVGQSKTKSDDWHAFLWQKRTMRDLGTLPDTEKVPVVELSSSGASDINERGQIVGRSGFLTSHAFLWEKGTMRDLGTLSKGVGMLTAVEAINERGQIVGSRDAKAKDKYGFAVAQHAFLWQKGKMRDLATLGGASSYAEAINERGQIVGHSETKSRGKDGDPISHAFLWENGTMRDLGTLGGPNSAAFGINDRGQIVGRADTKSGTSHAVLWTFKP